LEAPAALPLAQRKEARRHVVLDDASLRPLADEPIDFAQSPAGNRPVHFHRSTPETESLLHT
jgi:hypothetical protein